MSIGAKHHALGAGRQARGLTRVEEDEGDEARAHAAITVATARPFSSSPTATTNETTAAKWIARRRMPSHAE